MTFEETLLLNSGKAPIALFYKALMESEGVRMFYIERMNDQGEGRRGYWKGKILNNTKEKNRIVKAFELTHGIKIRYAKKKETSNN